jgi:predicted deacetylase
MLVAAAEGERRSIIVSLHDVAPATHAVCAEIVAELARVGVSVCSLLVVPDYHHAGSSLQNREFISWLRALQADGHEIVIHGYYHQRERRSSETLPDKCMTRFYTQDEGEFYDLPYDEAFRRITAAREEFTSAGLKPHGFIAPAWLMSEEAERAAADAGMEYTTGLANVRDLRLPATYRSRSLVYSTHKPWRRTVSRGWNAALFRRLKDAPLMRIAIHPPDIGCAEVWRQIRRLVAKAAERRTPTTYGTWVAQMRVRSSD